jgi:DNA-binding response OmpR family regulator
VVARGTIVVIEDDPSIARLVEMYLERDGFSVVHAADGTVGLRAALDPSTTLAVVDVGLPGAIDGLEVCRRLRAAGSLPVVMLTARDDEIDRILGLELGADDYITKPFSPRELVARVRAVLRRAGAAAPDDPSPAAGRAVLLAGGIEVDTGRREVRNHGAVVSLTTREFELLAYLARNAGLALTRPQILEGAWGPGWYGDERTVDVHIRQLRVKLGDDLPVTTVRGVGYRLG